MLPLPYVACRLWVTAYEGLLVKLSGEVAAVTDAGKPHQRPTSVRETRCKQLPCRVSWYY